jgi:hypothetical protein
MVDKKKKLLELYKSYTTIISQLFLISTIRYLKPTCRKTNPMVDQKKKVIRVVQKLYNNHFSYEFGLINDPICMKLIARTLHAYFIYDLSMATTTTSLDRCKIAL